METEYRNENFKPAYRWLNRFGKRFNTGTILLIVALVTIVIANSPLGEWYQRLWSIEVSLGAGNFNFFSHNGHAMTLGDLVNDALMAIFFFSVGLEIKREVLVGELSSFRQLLLPFLAACGGMIVPVAIFFLTGKAHAFSPDEMRGMAIPMATDIAFSLGVLSLFGKRVPTSLKVFLLALAIVDDIGGIVIIALFYSSLSVSSLVYIGVALLAFGILLLGSKLRINHKSFYGLFGIVIWYMFLQAGIHPTIAGVIVAFTVPARPYINLGEYTRALQKNTNLIKSTFEQPAENDIILTNKQVRYLTWIERASYKAISPLQDLEDSLYGPVNYLIMPLFAFANAGVIFNFPGGFGDIFSGVTLAIMAGLIIGKPLGIFSFTWLSIKLKISPKPEGMGRKGLFGISLLGGIGFTVALFLAGLSYPAGSDLLNQARLGIIFGSLISGLLGALYLRRALPKEGKRVSAGKA